MRFIAVMPEGVSNERVLMIRAYGGEIHLTPKAQGMRGALAETERLARRCNGFLPAQFSNPENAVAHELNTAPEILNQIPGGTVDAVVSGVGTGGTLVGIFNGLRKSGCTPVPVYARPVNLTHAPDVECCSYSTCIPGVVECISTIYREPELPGLMTIEVEDTLAIEATRALVSKGFPVGPSSGLNFLAAVEAWKRLDNPQAQVVTVFPDRMERYFTTELFAPYREATVTA